MPELPEVETFRRLLLRGYNGMPSVLGKVIQGAHVLWDGILVTPSANEFRERVPGQQVDDIGRRGKHLILHFSTDSLILHPRMSGEVLLESQDNPVSKHCRLSLDFKDGTRLAFINIRKFGRVWLTGQPEEVLCHLGPEPLSDTFTPQKLYAILQNAHRQLKYMLLDQHVIAGLGNIYTDEALYLAKLHPKTKSDTLSRSETERLWNAIRKVLREGIENQGTSIDWIYRGGENQKYLHVYNKDGDPCERCGNPIQKITIAQRGTHLCPTCQPPPSD